MWILIFTDENAYGKNNSLLWKKHPFEKILLIKKKLLDVLVSNLMIK